MTARGGPLGRRPHRRGRANLLVRRSLPPSQASGYPRIAEGTPCPAGMICLSAAPGESTGDRKEI